MQSLLSYKDRVLKRSILVVLNYVIVVDLNAIGCFCDFRIDMRKSFIVEGEQVQRGRDLVVWVGVHMLQYMCSVHTDYMFVHPSVSSGILINVSFSHVLLYFCVPSGVTCLSTAITNFVNNYF
jgi:hypothetical protein